MEEKIITYNLIVYDLGAYKLTTNYFDYHNHQNINDNGNEYGVWLPKQHEHLINK